MITIERTIAGESRRFNLLTADDLLSITLDMPNADGEIIDVRGLEKWAKNPKGCESFLFASARKNNPQLKRQDVAAWGSMVDRMHLAVEIFGMSISLDPSDPKVEGVTMNPPTGI